MQYLVNTITDIVIDKAPDNDGEAIILINGFESLKLYEEIAENISRKLKEIGTTFNIKLAKNKWEDLKEKSDTTTIQQMLSHGWVADQESVTFYRNQHNVNVLILMGTEGEEDTGGLLNCFMITPDWIFKNLRGKYSQVFLRCFYNDVSDDDKTCIDIAYRDLFECVPPNICKLSDFSDMWFHQFSTIEEFCEEFSNTLLDWGLPNNKGKLKPSVIKRKGNCLKAQSDFISRKLFNRLSVGQYRMLEKKLTKFQNESVDLEEWNGWKYYGFTDYDDFARTMLEFARGENVAENKKRLLKLDYGVVDQVLGLKPDVSGSIKKSETQVYGKPLEMMLNVLLTTLKTIREEEKEEASEIRYRFFSASIVTGYTDVNDNEKQQILADTWRNICIHVNGILDYINLNSWYSYGKPISISMAEDNFFDPRCVNLHIDEGIVSVVSNINTLNKVEFSVEVLDKDGNVLDRRESRKKMNYHYIWKFENEAGWLYDFKDIVNNSKLTAENSRVIPVGKMNHIQGSMVIKSEEEFFDLYEENGVDLSYDLNQYVAKRVKKCGEDARIFEIYFDNLAEAFCNFVREVRHLGIYSCYCRDSYKIFIQKYNETADAILKQRFAENQQWIMDAFLQSFNIQGDCDLIEKEEEPECVIIPPWHPAALQKIASQKQFLIDALSQKWEEADNTSGRKVSFNIKDILEHFIHATEIQASVDVFPTLRNNYMGVIGSYGDFCVYGNEESLGNITTRVKDILKKEVIYDEEFKKSELIQMNDDAAMIYDVIMDYKKAMPYAKNAMSLVFINPPDLQPIISAISKYTKDVIKETDENEINLKLTILVRPENKGGKNYLTYWMDDYFVKMQNVTVRTYLNEWSKKSELDKMLSENNDIIFNMDLMRVETFYFIPDPGDALAVANECRFPIVYKPSPLSKSSKKRKIELSQPQFTASFKHTQVVRYRKNTEVIPKGTYIATRESGIEQETKQIIDMLHKKAYWVVCVDKVMDGALLKEKEADASYQIIGFSTGKGMYGQYNLTITARQSILETVEDRMKARLYQLFKWDKEFLSSAIKDIMDESRSLDGISLLSAINQKDRNINEYMAYVMTSLREKKIGTKSALKIIIHLDSYRHWFTNTKNNDSKSRPDFLMLSVEEFEQKLKLKATIIECKIATYKNYDVHMEKAKKQVQHGLECLKELFDPKSRSIERRYWFAQLYRALVFAQVTFADNSDRFDELSSKLRAVLDGNFDIEWNGQILGYWIDKPGQKETEYIDDEIQVIEIPQERIQEIISNNKIHSYVEIDRETLETVDEEDAECEEKERRERFDREKELVLNPVRRYKELDETSSSMRKDIVVPKGQTVKPEDRDDVHALDANNEELQNSAQKESENQDEKDEENSGKVETDQKEKDSDIQKDTLENIRIKIGTDRRGEEIYWEFGNKGMANRHLLITGTSGQGKTYGIQTMLYEASKANISMVVFDYTEGFREDQLDEKFVAKMGSRIDSRVVYATGVPINPFKRQEIDIAGFKMLEKTSDVAQRIANTLSHVYNFGEQQFSAIYEASRIGLDKYGDQMSMEMLEKELNKSDNKAAKTVVSKMAPFIHSVEFSEDHVDWNDILYSEDGKLTIFQLTQYVRDIQVIITEFLLWDMWHYTKKYGSKNKPFVAVMDEAQNLSHTLDSPSGMILTEGRKFGWSAWFATQSIKILSNDEIVRLLQAAFKLYFKPTDEEIVSIAKQLNPVEPNEWRMPLSNLKKGECIVAGDRIQRDGTFKAGRPTITHVTSFEER